MVRRGERLYKFEEQKANENFRTPRTGLRQPANSKKNTFERVFGANPTNETGHEQKTPELYRFSSWKCDLIARKRVNIWQELAKQKSESALQKEQLKQEWQKRCREESAKLCQEDNRRYIESIKISPHISSPAGSWDEHFGRTSSAPTQLRSVPIWKFKDKDAGHYKIN